MIKHREVMPFDKVEIGMMASDNNVGLELGPITWKGKVEESDLLNTWDMDDIDKEFLTCNAVHVNFETEGNTLMTYAIDPSSAIVFCDEKEKEPSDKPYKRQRQLPLEDQIMELLENDIRDAEVTMDLSTLKNIEDAIKHITNEVQEKREDIIANMYVHRAMVLVLILGEAAVQRGYIEMIDSPQNQVIIKTGEEWYPDDIKKLMDMLEENLPCPWYNIMHDIDVTNNTELIWHWVS